MQARHERIVEQSKAELEEASHRREELASRVEQMQSIAMPIPPPPADRQEIEELEGLEKTFLENAVIMEDLQKKVIILPPPLKYAIYCSGMAER